MSEELQRYELSKGRSMLSGREIFDMTEASDGDYVLYADHIAAMNRAPAAAPDSREAFEKLAKGRFNLTRYLDRYAIEVADQAWWSWQAAMASKPSDAHNSSAAVAAIQFALSDDSPMEFLRCWNYGEFDAIRREWPDAPESVFIGADPLYKNKGEQQ